MFDVALLVDDNTVLGQGYCLAMLDTGTLMQEVIAESARYIAWKLEVPEVRVALCFREGHVVPDYDIPQFVNIEKATQHVRYATRHYGLIYQQRLRDYVAIG